MHGLKEAGIKVEPGDVVLVRTGRWALRDAKGPYDVSKLAGLYITSAKWLKEHDVAILGGDGAQDVRPSGIEGITEPIHALVADRDGHAHIRQPRSRSAQPGGGQAESLGVPGDGVAGRRTRGHRVAAQPIAVF